MSNPEFEKLKQAGDLLDLEASNKVVSLRRRIEENANKTYSTHVVLSHADPQTGDYGIVLWRRWTVDEVNEILSFEPYQKQVRSMITKEVLTKQEYDRLTDMNCDLVSRALVGESALSKADLLKLGDQRFVSIMWNLIAKKSGLDGSLGLDLEEFFRGQEQPRAGRAVSGAP